MLFYAPTTTIGKNVFFLHAIVLFYDAVVRLHLIFHQVVCINKEEHFTRVKWSVGNSQAFEHV